MAIKENANKLDEKDSKKVSGGKRDKSKRYTIEDVVAAFNDTINGEKR